MFDSALYRSASLSIVANMCLVQRVRGAARNDLEKLAQPVLRHGAGFFRDTSSESLYSHFRIDFTPGPSGASVGLRWPNLFASAPDDGPEIVVDDGARVVFRFRGMEAAYGWLDMGESIPLSDLAMTRLFAFALEEAVSPMVPRSARAAPRPLSDVELQNLMRELEAENAEASARRPRCSECEDDSDPCALCDAKRRRRLGPHGTELESTEPESTELGIPDLQAALGASSRARIRPE